MSYTPGFSHIGLSSPQGQAETRLRTTKTSQPKLALMRIRQIPIPLPPLAEQRRIAGVLNTIQDAIAAQEDVIAAARELKRSLMQRLFTYGPYREPAETKETEIGEIPVHWEMVEFGSQVDLLSGYAFKSEHYTDDYNAPRLLRGDNIAQGRLRWDNEKRWPLDGTEDIDRYWLRPGDVVLAMDRPWIPAGMKCAMVAESDVPSLLVQRVARLRPKKLDTSSFVKYLLTGHRFADYVLSVQTGTSVPHISGQQIRSFKLGLPPVSEQIQIGEELESVETKIAAEEDRLTALQALFKSMLHQLMTGQIRLLSDDGEFPVT
ncbi:MAG: restriction endonuclease subunit S [Caldilineaceae bacterium]|nr:restriction endonuclease subunit S [Caldilineaceae bacterium]